MKQARSSDMRHKVDVYKQVNVRMPNGEVVPKWKKDYSMWVREVTIFREQLERAISGGNTLRDRIEFETRYPCKLTTKNRIVHRGELYEVSIVGDTSGTHDRVRFLGEHLRSGGA